MSDAASTAKPPFPKKAGVIGGIVLLVIGLPMLLWGAWYLVEAIASTSWPSVEGRVQRVRVHRDTRGTGASRRVSYRYSVEYAYEVDGSGFESDKHALGSGNTAGRAGTHAEAGTEGRERFPVGSRVPVYYDPDDPKMAVLKPGAGSENWGTYVPTVLGLLFTCLGAWALLSVRALARRERAQAVAAEADPSAGP